MRVLRILVLASGVAGAAALFGSAASAMPVSPIHVDQSAKAEQVRLICTRWGRCWNEPSFRAYGFYRPGPVIGRPWWWRRHHWHHRHWY